MEFFFIFICLNSVSSIEAQATKVKASDNSPPNTSFTTTPPHTHPMALELSPIFEMSRSKNRKAENSSVHNST